MTVIVYDGETLASDSLMSGYDVRTGTVEKIRRLTDGRLFGFSGDYHLYDTVIAYVESERLEAPRGDYSAVVVNLDGSARLIKEGSKGVKVPVPVTLGSGCIIARAALHCGKGAVDAVKVAIELDVYSGGPVQALTRTKPKRRKT